MCIYLDVNFYYYSKFGQIHTHKKPAWLLWSFFWISTSFTIVGGGVGGIGWECWEARLAMESIYSLYIFIYSHNHSDFGGGGVVGLFVRVTWPECL